MNNAFPPSPPSPPTSPGPLGGDTAASRSLPPYSFESAFSIGLNSFKDQYGMLIAMSAIMFAASIAASVVENLVSMVNPAVSVVVSIALQLLMLYPVAAGTTFAGIRAARGERIVIADAGLGFQRYGTVVVMYVLVTLITALTVLPAALGIGVAWLLHQQVQGGAGDPRALSIIIGAVGVLISLALAMWVYTRLLLAPWIAVDPRWATPGPTECIRTSWRLTQPNFWSLVGLVIVTGIIVAVSVLMCCIGTIFLGLPIYMGIAGAAYAMICAPFFATACPNCGYDLAGLPRGTCPECGGETEPEGGSFN